ncbi:hypothetical protein K438DRAFT_1769858 [Mycena galopus ATCC 62051]|nr:hypothetical protein K438DRAFT_1769858 [Mycena galopus ATCC 62051]
MGGRKWMNHAQYTFLLGHLPAYIVAAEGSKGESLRKQDTFFVMLDEEWFKRWPEPARAMPEETQALMEARKGQLKTWMRYRNSDCGCSVHGAALAGRRQKSGSLFEALIPQKSTRLLHPMEVYQTMCREKIGAEVPRQKLATAAGLSNSTPRILLAEELEVAEIADREKREGATAHQGDRGDV